MRTAIQSVFFTILMPGSVTVLIPLWVLGFRPEPNPAVVWRTAGWLMAGAGALVLLLCIAEFVLRGGGTPAIWFTRGLRWVVGEEPGVLIRSALYSRVRNPMYVAILIILYGEALWFGSRPLAMYAAACMLFFHLTVIWLEEPHLRRKHGTEYEAYCASTPRWLPKVSTRRVN